MRILNFYFVTEQILPLILAYLTIPHAIHYNYTRLCMRVNLTIFKAIWSIHIFVRIGVWECVNKQQPRQKHTGEYLLPMGADPLLTGR